MVANKTGYQLNVELADVSFLTVSQIGVLCCTVLVVGWCLHTSSGHDITL